MVGTYIANKGTESPPKSNRNGETTTHTARNVVIILTLAAIGLSGTAQAAEKGNKNRMERYRVTQSDIKHEARRLKKQQRKIGRMERRFNANGYLSGRERYRLERASRRIARLKHNDIYRGSGHRYAYGRYVQKWNR